jgi:hypothetical protein
MTTQELIQEELKYLDESQLQEVLEVARALHHHAPNTGSTSRGLMARLREISIDAPGDFSALREWRKKR